MRKASANRSSAISSGRIFRAFNASVICDWFMVHKKDGEDVFVKNLIPDKDRYYPPQEIYREFYPSFYDGKKVSKFIVPIIPKWHNRLFTEYKKRQLTLLESVGEFIVEEYNKESIFVPFKN